jgi:hypothetical protein
MSKAFEEIAKEAAQLSAEQRLNLASVLLEMNEGGSDENVSAIWEEEILARIRAIEDGEVDGVPFEIMLRDAEDRLGS